jgi:hypothetical protein
MPSPGGLSGGPLFRPRAHVVVIGVATENFQSTTQLHADEEIVDGRERRATSYREVVNYGLALALDSVLPWVDEHVPEEHERDVAALQETRQRFSSK